MQSQGEAARGNTYTVGIELQVFGVAGEGAINSRWLDQVEQRGVIVFQEQSYFHLE